MTHFGKPLLFISYSRRETELVKFLSQLLQQRGFRVFLDQEKITVGEKFITEIISNLRKCDGFITVLSNSSASSDWCQAELYYARALNKVIIPFRIENEDLALPDPIRLLLQDLNYFLIKDSEQINIIDEQVIRRLTKIKQRARMRTFKYLTIILALIVFLALILKYGVNQINIYGQSQQRKGLVDRIRNTESILNQESIKDIRLKFNGDFQLEYELYALNQDIENSTPTRLNAWLLLNAFTYPRHMERRWYVEGITWENSYIQFADLSSMTFVNGNYHDLTFNRVSLPGTVWNQSPSSSNPDGLMLSSSKFNFCSFHGGEFAETGMVKVDFENCRFNGTEIGVTNFGAVHFYTHQADTASSVITDELTSFANCTIYNNNVDQPGTITILNPDSEVRFSGVFFESCHFRGLIRNTWFTECTFSNCIFPESLDSTALTEKNNLVLNFLMR